MHIRAIALLTLTATLATACSPGPGSADWCKGVMEGKIQATAEQLAQNSEKCAAELMKMIPAGLQ